MNKQTEALKMAITQFERIDKEYDCTEIIDICKEALAQSAQEPIGYISTVPVVTPQAIRADSNDVFNIPVYTHPAPAQEPVSLGDFDRMTKAECVEYIDYLRKEIDLLRFKEWQGLSDYDILSIDGLDCVNENDLISFAHAVVAKVKEKNK